MWATGAWGIGRGPEPDKTQESRTDRVERVRLLRSSLDSLRLAAVERTRQVETKASFVVVAAGVLASATGIELISTDTLLVGLIPFALTIATVAVSTVALWPRKLNIPSGRSLVDRWVESDATPDDLEDYLLEVSAVEIELRDAQNEDRVKWSKRGFWLLLVSLLTAFLVAAANGISPMWSENDGQQRIQAPASPEATDAPER